MPIMNAVKISTANGTARVESAMMRPGDRVEHAPVVEDEVEAHRHDDAGDHLRDEEQEVEDRAAPRAQLCERKTGGRGEHQGDGHRAEPDEQAGAQIGELLVNTRE